MLPDELQEPFERVFGELIAGAIASAPPRTRGPSEVDWLKSFHAQVGESLGQRLRESMRAAGLTDSVYAQSAFVHGNPFQILPETPLSRRVEAGDLLLVGERYERAGLVERQALLLQMKVGEDFKGESTVQQMLLYSAWPPVEWSAQALRALPGVHPRTPRPEPTRAAQFGTIPARAGDLSVALELVDTGGFAGVARDLAAEMAAVTRLAICVDATPGVPDGWPRIVEDMLERSLGLEYGREGLPRSSRAFADEGEDSGEVVDDSGGFATVVVSTGPVGMLD